MIAQALGSVVKFAVIRQAKLIVKGPESSPKPDSGPEWWSGTVAAGLRGSEHMGMTLAAWLRALLEGAD